MSDHIELENIELLCVIVNFGLGGKVLQIAKQSGIKGGTVFLGKGTVNNPILEFLALADVRKEIVLLITSKAAVGQVVRELDREFKFEKPNHGIAFATSIASIVGASSYRSEKTIEGRGANEPMYHSITVVVDKGRAEFVIDAATKAGSRGGTIINARGSGIHETSKVFSMDIVPEKEIVLILSEGGKTDAIVASIRTELNIDEPGNGMIYIQEVTKTYGLYK